MNFYRKDMFASYDGRVQIFLPLTDPLPIDYLVARLEITICAASFTFLSIFL